MTDLEAAIAAGRACARQLRIIDAHDVKHAARRQLDLPTINTAMRILAGQRAVITGRHWTYHSLVYGE